MSVAYGLVFTTLAALAAVEAALAPGWLLRVPGVAGGLSFLLVACAYFGAGPRLLFKRPDGRRVVWAVHGRSALVVAASLLAVGRVSDPKSALKQLRELRPGVRLRRSQRNALEAWARR
jgi:hypothetical protein